MSVIQSFDGDEVLFSAASNAPEGFQQEAIADDAVDELADMDFMATLATEELALNEGEISYVAWNGSNFIQERKSVPASSVHVEEDEDPQYVHLIVPMQYYRPQTNATLGPWIRRDEILSAFPFTPYSYAETTEWQGVSETDEPSYLVSTSETLSPEENVFKCLICTVTNGAVEQNHAGAITLPQGYIGGLEQT